MTRLANWSATRSRSSPTSNAEPLRYRPRRLFLVGMMGAGKSTTARALADRLGWSVFDTDAAIEKSLGLTVAQLFAAEGEEAFRTAEHAALLTATEIAEPAVISVGGGAVSRDVNRRLMAATGTVVWLRASVATLAARVGSGRGRPLLAGADGPIEATLATLYEQRLLHYQMVAHLVLDVDGMAPADVARRIEDLAGLGPTSTERI